MSRFLSGWVLGAGACLGGLLRHAFLLIKLWGRNPAGAEPPKSPGAVVVEVLGGGVGGGVVAVVVQWW